MRQIFSILAVIILFLISGLIFWAGLSPKTFASFWQKYPTITEPVGKAGILLTHDINNPFVSSSEEVISNQGQIIVGQSTWNVEVVFDESSREAGLSNRKALSNNKGMLFAFDKMEYQSFWMKDMLIPIDIIFFDDQWSIVLIEEDVDPNTFPKVFGNTVKSKYVLEINARKGDTLGLKVGDQAIFLNK